MSALTATYALANGDQIPKIGFGTWAGILLGVALKLGLGFAMLGLFALAWWL